MGKCMIRCLTSTWFCPIVQCLPLQPFPLRLSILYASPPQHFLARENPESSNLLICDTRLGEIHWRPPWGRWTMVQINLMLRHLIIHFLMSSDMSVRAHEQREQCRVSKWVSGASKWANGRASGSVLTSGFLVVLNHSAMGPIFSSSSSLTSSSAFRDNNARCVFEWRVCVCDCVWQR